MLTLAPVTKKKKVSPPKNVEEFRKRLEAINNIPISFNDDPARLLETKSEGRVANVYSKSLELCTGVLESGTKDTALLKAARETGDKLRSNLSVVMDTAKRQTRVRNSIENMVGMGRVEKRIEDYDKAREADRERGPPEPDVKKARVVLASARPGKVAASEAEASETGKQVPTEEERMGKYIIGWLDKRFPFTKLKDRIKMNYNAYKVVERAFKESEDEDSGEKFPPVSDLSEKAKQTYGRLLDVKYTAMLNFGKDVNALVPELKELRREFVSKHSGNKKLIERYDSLISEFQVKPFPEVDREYARALGHELKEVNVREYAKRALESPEPAVSPEIRNADFKTSRPQTKEEKKKLEELDGIADEYLRLLEGIEDGVKGDPAKEKEISLIKSAFGNIVSRTIKLIIKEDNKQDVGDIVATLGQRIKNLTLRAKAVGIRKPGVAKAGRKRPDRQALKELKEVKGKIASLRERVRGGEVKGEEKVKLQKRIYKLKQRRDDLADALARKEGGKTGGLAMARKKEKGERA